MNRNSDDKYRARIDRILHSPKDETPPGGSIQNSMKRKATCQEMMAILDQLGVPTLPPDHPIFSEGPSITFLSHAPAYPPRPRTSLPRSASIEHFKVGSRGTLAKVGYRNIYRGQDAAYEYFLRVPSGDLRKLGVVVVEGQCPGNDWCGAELHQDIRTANRAAKAAGLSVRFRKLRGNS